MGFYYVVASETKREVLISPYAAKAREWNHPHHRSANIVLWTLFQRWSGDRISVVVDAADEYDGVCRYRNVWAEMEADYLKANGPWRDYYEPTGTNIYEGFVVCPECGADQKLGTQDELKQ